MADKHPFLDFKIIKARVGIADVLARYQVALARVNQTALRGNCPLPSHTSDSKKTFYINEAKSVWYCHSDSCRTNGQRAGGNIIDFVALMERCSVYAAAKSIDEWFPRGRDNGTARTVGTAESAPRVAAPASAEASVADGHNKPLAFALKDVNPAHPMIQERGISIGTAERFGVGFFPGKGSMAGRIVFPLHENGNLVGYAGRTTLPVSDSNPKWLFGKGLKKRFLYGLGPVDPAKPVILCESLWGPLWFYEHGSQALSLMGSEMTEEQERCLDPYPVITVALDNDAAGRERAVRIRERLRGKHKVLKANLIG
jgi:DNA primase